MPSLTLSPSATFSSFTTPACDDGISIDALSLLHRDQRLLGLHRVAGLDQQLDDLDVLEVADVRHLTSTSAMVCLLSVAVQAYSGLILSASMPYFAIASATLAAGTVPSSASAFSAATTM